jgi:hypothetical protein
MTQDRGLVNVRYLLQLGHFGVGCCKSCRKSKKKGSRYRENKKGSEFEKGRKRERKTIKVKFKGSAPLPQAKSNTQNGTFLFCILSKCSFSRTFNAIINTVFSPSFSIFGFCMGNMVFFGVFQI